MVYIYVLQLENNKYYIGKTNNPDNRISQHIATEGNYGSAWTNKNKPLKVMEIIPNCDDYDEDKYTIKYMEKYGINNVRGGSFCEIILNKSNIETIKKMINGSSNKCYLCGMEGHYINNCKEEWIDICNRCNREGHCEEDCYAKTNINGNKIKDTMVYVCSYCDKEFETEKGAKYHQNFYCKNLCKRCGRDGHNIKECYAKKHVDGYYIK